MKNNSDDKNNTEVTSVVENDKKSFFENINNKNGKK